MKSLLATDLDGTLFYPQRKLTMIPKRNITFLRRYIDGGGKVVLVTSRNREYADKVIAKVKRPLDIIGGNGTFIIADGKMLQDQSLENHLAEALFDFVEKNFSIRAWMLQSREKGLCLYVGDISFFKKKMYQLYYAWQGVYKEKYSFGNALFMDQLKNAQLYKLMLYFGIRKDAPEIAKKTNIYIREHYPSVESSWIRQFIEITPHGCNKGEGLKKYCQTMGYDSRDVHVVGDSGNDIAMFKSFENSYCMDHAAPSVKKYAKHMIRRIPDLERYLPKEKE
jgi:Cof subfamily protein (haloacid dehalogenase superfamily)